MRIKDFVLALFLSLIVTFVLTCLYVFYPLISMLSKPFLSNDPNTSGIVAIAGGVSSTGVLALLLVETSVFVVILGLLNRKRTNK
jgi:uncharacterized membrane protein YhaH (DUF805 family)